MLVSVLALLASGVTSLEGDWRNPSGSVIITIAPCGEAMCGRVRWASDRAMADARRGGTDSLVGAELLTGFIPRGPGRWKGQIFVPDANRRSRAELVQLGPDQVRIRGCAVGRMLLCKSQVWNRVEPEAR